MQTGGLEQLKKREVTTEDLTLHTADGFERRYFKNLATSKSCTEAYDKTEEQYNELFGRNRYSGYNSFRNVMNKRNKN